MPKELENEINKIFARRLKHYLNIYDMSQKDLAERLNVSATTVSNWVLGTKAPRMGKVDAMCKIFHCKRSDLIEDKPEDKYSGYYFDDETAKAAQEIFENKDLRGLFDAARDASPEDLQTVHTMLLALKRKEQHED